MREWIEVDGRSIQLHDGERTQSVNVCTPTNEAGQYEQVFYFTGKWRVQPDQLEGLADMTAVVTMLRQRQYRQVYVFSPPACDRVKRERMAQQIPLDGLVVGRHYVGRGRNGNVGLWDGDSFRVMGEKFGNRVIKLEGYYGPEDGCFQPFWEINEGRTVEAFGVSGWDAHYARVLELDDELPLLEGERHAELGAATDPPPQSGAGWLSG